MQQSIEDARLKYSSPYGNIGAFLCEVEKFPFSLFSMRYLNFLFTLFLLSCTQEKKPFLKSADTLFSLKEDSGVDFNNKIIETSSFNYLFYESIYNGAGVGVADLDGDGLEDLFFAGNQVADRLYKNLGNLRFEDISKQSGISDDGGWSSGVSIADLNGDGLLDIYVCRFMLEDAALRQNLLYINQGEMKFKESAASFGLNDAGYSSQATFLDYDKDGRLDLFLVNQPPNNSAARQAIHPDSLYQFSDRLYHNDGDHFSDRTAQAGMIDKAYGHVAIASDLNADGLTDIYVTNDFDEPDFLYINQGDGTFKDEAKNMLQHMSNFSMGADIADIDNDGLLDIFTADMVAEDNKRLKTNMSGMNPKKFYALVEKGYHHQYMFNSLQINRGNGHFSEIAQLANVYATDWSWSALLADLDSDGNKDILVTNGLKKDVRDNDFNIARRKRVRELQEEATAAGKTGIDVNPLELMELSPSTPLSNYIYKNSGSYQFEKAMKEWGLDQKGMSHGAAYADLDNDGDLDLIMNNMDAPAFILENQREKYVDHHGLQVELKGAIPYGSVVSVKQGDKLQTQEYQTVRGFMSSSTGILNFGFGTDSSPVDVHVQWPDGKVQEFKQSRLDQRMIAHYSEAKVPGPKASEIQPLFSAVNLIDFKHTENLFDDFLTEILIPHRMSTQGPCIATADVNGDGLEDVFIGAAKGSNSSIFFQSADGFTAAPALPDSRRFEDTGASFFDMDGDGDQDLYVASGGNEDRRDFYVYQDRLYENDGKGNFKDVSTRLPHIKSSTSCVRPCDFDGDGDIDLFVGGRQVPGKYPFPAKSLLLKNEGGRFVDVINGLAIELEYIGMVTDALWSDRDGDGSIDLTVVGEWMPVTFFSWNMGQLSKTGELPNSLGWWNCIKELDVDGDGDMDMIAGNLGLNIKYKASPEAPFEIFSADFDKSGNNDIYMAYHQDGNCFPVRGRECSSQQLPFVKERFPNYDQFSKASVYEVLGADTAGALHYSAQQFASVFLINDGAGNYVMKDLPIQAQFSSVNSILFRDVDRDGIHEIILFGNQFDREVETTRGDASYGLLLKKNKAGEYVAMPQPSFGIYAGTNVRGAALIEWNKKSLIITVNSNDQVFCFAENQISESP